MNNTIHEVLLILNNCIRIKKSLYKYKIFKLLMSLMEKPQSNEIFNIC